MFFDHWANLYAISLLTPAIFFLLLHINKSKFVIKVILIVSAIKWLLMMINCYGTQFYFFESDFNVLDSMAREWASMPLESMPSEIPKATGRYFFAFLLGLMYRSIGEAICVVFLVNIFLTAIVASCTYDTLKAVFNNRRIERTGFLIVAFFPAYFAYSIDPSREPLVQVGVALGLKYFFLWIKDSKASRIPRVIAPLLLAASIHSAMAILLLFICAAMGFESLRSRRDVSRSNRVVSGFFIVAISSVVLPVVIFSGWALKKVGGDLSGIADMEVLSTYETRQDAASRTGYIQGDAASFSSATGALAGLPLRLLYFTTKPWPWNISAPLDLVAAYANVLLLLALSWAVFRRDQLRKYGGLNYIGLAIIGLCLMFAFGTVNWGTATRHKTKFLPAIVLILAARRVERQNANNAIIYDKHPGAAH